MTEAKKGFVDSVVAFLKLDEAGKVAKFQKQALKKITKQIAIRKEQLEELLEKQAEYANERVPEVILNVDVARLTSVESRESYFENTYLPAIEKVLQKEDTFDDEIAELEEQISTFERIAAKLV